MYLNNNTVTFPIVPKEVTKKAGLDGDEGRGTGGDEKLLKL